MLYLIDGHNLIPHVPGLDLSMIDDEDQLLRQLLAFCQRGHHSVEVFFDQAPPTQAGSLRSGRLTIHSVHSSSTADAAIRKRLQALGARAKNLVVVSSDLQVQAAARQRRSQVMKADEFARLLMEVSREAEAHPPSQASLSEDELEGWLKLFQNGKSDKDS